MHLLRKLQENTELAQIKIKPSMSEACFHICNEPIPMVAMKPIKSLNYWYDVFLKDTEQIQQLRQNHCSYIGRINSTMLIGKLKLWCLQFGFLAHLM